MTPFFSKQSSVDISWNDVFDVFVRFWLSFGNILSSRWRAQTFCILCLSTSIGASLNRTAKEGTLWAMCTKPWCRGKKKSYKAAICWFLDSHFPTSCEEGVRWSFFPCFLVERNAPQKRPVLFAKSGHAIWIWRSLYETSHPAGRVALIPVIIPRATYLPRNPWLVLPWLVRHGIKIIKWVCALLRESSQKNDKKKHKNCFAKIAKCWYLKKNYWMPYLFKKNCQPWKQKYKLSKNTHLVGGFNPSEKYLSNWIISPIFGVNIIKICELPPPSHQLVQDLDLSPPNTLRSQSWCAPPKTPTLAMGFERETLGEKWGKLKECDQKPGKDQWLNVLDKYPLVN